MVSQESVIQAFYVGEGNRPMTPDDLQLFLAGQLDAIERQFQHAEFFPNYIPPFELKLLTALNRELISQEVFTERRSRLVTRTDPRDSYALASQLLQTAFDLFEVLQNTDEHPVTEDDAQRFGELGTDYHFVPEKDGSVSKREVVTLTFEVAIPNGDYLQFIADGCEVLSKSPFWADCFVHNDGGFVKRDDVTGQLLDDSGQLTFTAWTYPGKKCHEQLLISLLKFLLDLHLHDVQMVTYGVGQYTLVAKHALSALWVLLREDATSGRTGTCRVCGRRFIAHDERGIKRAYCDKTCSRVFARTKNVLKLIDCGMSGPDAASQVDGISWQRALDIALRNRRILSEQFPSIDFDKLAERR